jgi:A/G-specific adenine glycosylase
MISSVGQKDFSKKLLSWWRKNKRDFYWRNTWSPYHILISEVLLHRTKAEQVAKVYTKFLQEFPSIKRLVQARDSEIRKILYPLGLHWRTLLIRKMAKEILNQYGGKIPSGKEELEQLPGVSDYISSAVRCFAFGYPEVLLDTNTVRVVGRVFGLKITDGSRRSRRFRELLESLVDKKYPREFNWAMIDFAALMCTPRGPKCPICPMKSACIYITR